MYKYPKILHIGASLIGTIFDESVEISEKVDGSQCRIYLADNVVMVGSKNQDEADYGMFRIAHQQGERIHDCTGWDSFGSEVLLFCEFLRSPKHNTLVYDRVPKNNLYLFGAVVDGKHYYTNELENLARVLDIDPPNVLSFGKVNSLDEIKEFLAMDSYLGGSTVEGIVVKNYNRTYDPLMVHSQAFIGYPMVGKCVREDFKEKNIKRWNMQKSKKGIDAIVDVFFTPARLHKAIQHISDEGKLNYEKRDLQFLIPEFFNDLMEEEKDAITSMIMSDVFKEVKRRAGQYVVREYIGWLAEREAKQLNRDKEKTDALLEKDA